MTISQELLKEDQHLSGVWEMMNARDMGAFLNRAEQRSANYCMDISSFNSLATIRFLRSPESYTCSVNKKTNGNFELVCKKKAWEFKIREDKGNKDLMYLRFVDRLGSPKRTADYYHGIKNRKTKNIQDCVHLLEQDETDIEGVSSNGEN